MSQSDAGLSGTVRAEVAEHLALPDLQDEPVQRGERPESLGQLLGDDGPLAVG
jgi:hypothetical protein